MCEENTKTKVDVYFPPFNVEGSAMFFLVQNLMLAAQSNTWLHCYAVSEGMGTTY